MSETVRSQILAIRDSGKTNMFDVPVVRCIAAREGYIELIEYLEAHTPEYAKFILYGDAALE